MALSPNVNDKNRGKVKAHIKELEKSSSAQAADQLKEEFNMGDKDQSSVIVPNKIAAK